MSVTSNLGSAWRRWDLHFHTQSSYDYGNGAVTDKEIVDGLISAEIDVVAITDHHKLDARRIRNLQALGGTKLAVLPGIELNSELGGSEHVHYIGIFPETSDLDDLWTKLSAGLGITESDVLRKGATSVWCEFGKGSELIHKLGGLVSVHAGRKTNSIENLANADAIKRVIKKDFVERGLIDILEIGKIEDENDYKSVVFPHLSRVVPIIICSDNHNIGEYSTKCPLWIKGDSCFEGLRQALYEPFHRVCISEARPLEPLLRIEKVLLDFPADAELKSKDATNPFCFRGRQEISFSPYLTCLVGGRGSGKSTVLNLLHEKMHPGKNRFFEDKSIVSNGKVQKIEDAVTVDEDVERIEIEFLHQNEIEQFALDPSRFTSAVFARLVKLDSNDKLSIVDTKIEKALDLIGAHSKAIEEFFRLREQLNADKQDLKTNKRLVDSFQNDEYKELRDSLGAYNKQSQRIKSARERLREFAAQIREVISEYVSSGDAEGDETAHESALIIAKQEIENVLQRAETATGIEAADATLLDLEERAAEIKRKLEAFLRERGLSPENLADVGRASERIAKLEQNIPVTERRLVDLDEGIKSFVFEGELRDDYANAVSLLLSPINEKLAKQGDQVRPIRLQYEFDSVAAREYLETKLSRLLVNEDDRKIRTDHLARALEDVDFFQFPKKADLLNAIKTESKTGQTVFEYFEEDEYYHGFMQEVRSAILSVDKFRRIRLFYDERPIEAASFGQRCTAAIVVLILLGNTPIIIDEPEAHLDSSLIAKYLVHLVKDKKVERQIIFATHNANFVINGDAELIHILKADGDAPSTLTSTTIENLEHRESLLALEGGHDAFIQRENRYGIK